MRVKTIATLSWKNIWAHKLRALLTIGGVAIGVGAIIFLVSLGFGLERLVTSQVTNFTSFTVIDITTTGTEKISTSSINKVKKLDHVIEVGEVADMAGRAGLGSADSATETVIVAAEPNYFQYTETTTEKGRVFATKDSKEAVINTALAGLLGYKGKEQEIVDQTLVLDLIVPGELRAKITGDKEVKKISNLKITGLINDDKNPVVYMPLGIAEEAGVAKRTLLKAKVDDRNNVPFLRQELEKLGFTTEYIGDTLAQISQAFAFFRVLLAGFGMIALIVAGLGTINILTISLMERIREVGLLKTLGLKKRGIFQLFITESLIIGVMGGFLGIMLSGFFGWLLNYVVTVLAVRSGATPVAIYFTPSSLILFTAIGSILIGFLTGFYPAYRAVKTNPLDVLRYE